MQSRTTKTSQNNTSAPQSNPFQTRPFESDTLKKSQPPSTDIDLETENEPGKSYGLDLKNVPTIPTRTTNPTKYTT
ncbi:hypothetical protein FJR38_12310 [Anabaena sp. UHCC 0253]|uniref:hypothetical protein n=1 Tax=Anabaena sp. UHCC 0253 TaxID=2590019 RepID=UPI0014457526|nr:hypothetical protein [Anabaena sp. UHCC 0253]MTJ53372.1 hypothetical protein [Anabaena sp. UHCC 0253]